MPADRVKTGLIDLFAYHFGEFRRFSRARGEARLPVPKRAVAVGDRQQPDMRHIVEHRNWRIEQSIAEGLFEFGERQHLLAHFSAVLKFEPPHSSVAIYTLSPLV